MPTSLFPLTTGTWWKPPSSIALWTSDSFWPTCTVIGFSVMMWVIRSWHFIVASWA